ncbi:hypothetical protein Tco_0064788 [Tanacetum coccineum]
MSRYYTLDEDTYLSFLHDDKTDMDLFAFIQVVNPTKMRVVGRERTKGEEKLLDFTVGRVVLLLPVAPARTESELEASMDRLFDEGGSTEQVDSAVGGGHDADIEQVTATKNVAVVTAERPIRHHKKNILNVKVGVEAVATLPLVTSSVSIMSGHEGGHPTDSIIGINLRTIGASERFVISLDSSHHSSAYASGAEVDSIIRSAILPPVMTKAIVTSHTINAPSVMVLETGTKITSPVHASMFHDSKSMETVKADVAGPFYSAKQDLSMGSRELNAETLHQELVDHLAPPALFSHIREMDYHYLFTKVQCWDRSSSLPKCGPILAAEAAEKVHASEMDALKQKNVVLENKRDSFNGKILELQSSVSAKDLELKEVNVVAFSLKSQNDSHVDQVLGYEQLKEQVKEFQDAQMNIVSDKVAKLDADLLEMALHLEEKFYPHLLTTISGRRWLLTRGIRLAVVKCLNSPEYLTALGSAISRSIEKGMQDGLSAGINHRKAALTRMKVLRILWIFSAESPLADAPEVSDLQPDIEHLIIPIDRPKDQVRSALIDVSVPLVDPLSAKNLIGATSTSSRVPAAIVTTTALSTTFASASSVPPIITDDYDIVNVDGHEDAQGNVASFPTVEFEKE